MQGKNERCPVPFQSGLLSSMPQTFCQRACQEWLAKCLPVLEEKCQNNVVSTTWKNVSWPKHRSSPHFPVVAILFLSQHKWRRVCLLSMISRWLFLVMQAYICVSYTVVVFIHFNKLFFSTQGPLHARALYWHVMLVCHSLPCLSHGHPKTGYEQHWFTPLLVDEITMQLREKRKALLYAGIGFVLIGIVSIILTYMLLY